MEEAIELENVKVNRLFIEDREIDLFEGQYPVPEGVTYNTAVLEGEKTIIVDTVDHRCCGAWMEQLEAMLSGKKPEYLIISHMEPDHSGSISSLCEKYPEIELIGNAKTFSMLDQFTADAPIACSRKTVKEGEMLDIGGIRMQFFTAPMVHWPEVMMTYLPDEKLLFAADAFGRFGDADPQSPWSDEGRRYYTNIVGKYGTQVQMALKKASALEIQKICPLHGPDLEGELLTQVLEYYKKWSTYTPEDEGTLVAYAGFHGNTKKAAEEMAAVLENAGNSVALIDLARTNKSYAVAEAFRHKHLVLAATTYDASYMPAMEAFLNAIKAKGLQGRRVGLIENGTWAPMAAKLMRAQLETMKNMEICEEQVTLRSVMTQKNREEIAMLAHSLLKE